MAKKRKANGSPPDRHGNESDSTPLFGSLDAMPDVVFHHLIASGIILLLSHIFLWFANGGYLNLVGATPFFLWGLSEVAFYWRNRDLLFAEAPRWGFSAHFFDYVFFLGSFIAHGGLMLFFGRFSSLLTWNGPLLLVLLAWGFALIMHTFLVLQPGED